LRDSAGARRPHSYRGANSRSSAVFCNCFLSKSTARPIPSHAPLGNCTKAFCISISSASLLSDYPAGPGIAHHRALLNPKGFDHVVLDDSNVPVDAPPPSPWSHGARGTVEGLRQVGWIQVRYRSRRNDPAAGAESLYFTIRRKSNQKISPDGFVSSSGTVASWRNEWEYCQEAISESCVRSS